MVSWRGGRIAEPPPGGWGLLVLSCWLLVVRKEFRYSAVAVLEKGTKESLPESFGLWWPALSSLRRRPMGGSYQDLVVWQKAKQLALEIYRDTKLFPREELYGLTLQLRRAAISVPSNIAEGQARLTPRDFRNFLGHARGSLAELCTQVEIAHDLGYLTTDRFRLLSGLTAEVARLLNALQTAIKIRSEHYAA